MPLRDAGVLLASCAQGYKTPISSDDVIEYLNQINMVVSPMLHRMGICRNLIKQQSENDFDVLMTLLTFSTKNITLEPNYIIAKTKPVY